MEEEQKSPRRSIHRKSSRIFLKEKQFRPEFHGQLKGEERSDKLWKLMAEYLDPDLTTIQKSIVSHVEYTLARTRFNFDNLSCYRATAFSVRDRLIESWNDSQQIFTASDNKRVYYMSLEYLLGRLLKNNLYNINLENDYKEALNDLGFKLEDLYEEEIDPALGNGGLGRLAACYLDSLATLEYPGWGYGIRYDYGMFRQKIIKGYQVEMPDYWLIQQNPWEIERSDIAYDIYFGGHVESISEGGREKRNWIPAENIIAMAYDTPISGYRTFNTINLRLWRSRPTNEFDFSSFNAGDYFEAVKSRQEAELITSVLYPNDITYSGKELRLRQQYFFCSATIQDVIRRFLKKNHRWDELPNKVAIQLNDTHPTLAIPEMLRILIDLYDLDPMFSWKLVQKVFAYTNHTIFPEAMEKWPIELFQKLFPRHLEIIYSINFQFMQEIQKRYENESEERRNHLLSALSLIEEGEHKKIRMANLCNLTCHKINGVSQIHTNLLKSLVFKDFNEYFPHKIINITNGVTPRRWIHCANSILADIYNKYLDGSDWLTDLSLLRNLEPMINDSKFQEEWSDMKFQNKTRLTKFILKETGIEVSPYSMFDVIIKRFHEYKRQLLLALYIIYHYQELKHLSADDKNKIQPKVYIFAGKAMPTYIAAKKSIKLINCVADVINNDAEIGNLIKVIFIPNYSVSIAELIIPATDLSEQISTAGTEASGTSNMKFVMNGGVIIGTMDGANVEIAEEIGEDSMFIFGARLDQVQSIRESLTKGDHPIDPRLKNIFTLIREDRFGNAKEMESLLEGLEKNDTYLLCHDFSSYIEAHERSDAAYKDKIRWNRMSISGALHASKFSSDRSIEDYSELVWNLTPVTVPTPAENPLMRVKTQPHLVDANTNLEKLREMKEHKEADMINAIEDIELIDSLNKEEMVDRRPTTFQ